MNHEQGSQTWKSWRKEGLTSTTAAVTLGISKYQTPYELYRWYVGLDPDINENAHMARGTRLEPKARAFVELQMGLYFDPACMEWSDNKLFRASLDGYNERQRAVLEIKCPAEKNHKLNLSGEIQDYYLAQVQHQMLVAGAEICYFVSYFEPEGSSSASVKIIEVRPDKAMQEEIVKCGLAFWNHVQTKTPPPLSERDTMVLENEPMLDTLAKLYDELQLAKEAYDTMREEIITRLPHPRVKCGRVSISNNRVTIRENK